MNGIFHKLCQPPRLPLSVVDGGSNKPFTSVHINIQIKNVKQNQHIEHLRGHQFLSTTLSFFVNNGSQEKRQMLTSCEQLATRQKSRQSRASYGLGGIRKKACEQRVNGKVSTHDLAENRAVTSLRSNNSLLLPLVNGFFAPPTHQGGARHA